MSAVPFAQVDVFATHAFSGNPLAVILDGSELTDEQMQCIAHWTNLSETTFVLPPTPEGACAGADYRVRIFTATHELPFAGHPTLGTAHAWLDAGHQPRATVLVQECGAGLVSVRRQADGLAFAAPALVRSGPVEDALLAETLAALQIDAGDVLAAQWVDNGPGWLAVWLRSADDVRRVRPDPAAMAGRKVGLVGMCAQGPHAYEVRALFDGIEDPVTGSLNASLAQWLRSIDAVPTSYTATQGSQVARDGVIGIDDDGDNIWVSGRVVTRIAGTISP